MTGFEMNEVNNFTEDSTSAGDTVTTVKTAPSDEDGGDITYSISDTTNYAINETTGEVTLTEAGANLVNSGQELPAFNVTATSAGVDGSSQTVQNLDPAVTTVNDAAVVENVDLGSTNEDTSIIFTQEQLLQNASDEDGDTLTVTSVSIDSSYGNIVDNGNGTYTFNPTADFSGDNLPINFTVSDGTVSTNGTATIDVASIADAPTINLEITQDTLIDISNVDNNFLGTTINAYDAYGNSAELVVIEGTNHDGIGVAGRASGANAELGYVDNVGSETIVLDFDNYATNVDVAFAWQNSGETVVVEFKKDGQTVGTRVIEGGSDGVDAITSLSADNGEIFDQVVFSAQGHDDDYLIHSIKIDQVATDDAGNIIGNVDYINISSALADTDGSESLQVVLDGIPNGVIIGGVEVTDGTYSFDVDGTSFDGSISMIVPSSVTEDFTINATAVATELSTGEYKTSVNSVPVEVNATEYTAPSNTERYDGDNYIVGDAWEHDEVLTGTSGRDDFDIENGDRKVVNAGDGDDYILKNDSGHDTQINAGEGNDYIHLDEDYIDRIQVDAGEGNDTIYYDQINGNRDHNIDGGTGLDKIVIDGNAGDFQIINNGDNTFSINSVDSNYWSTWADGNFRIDAENIEAIEFTDKTFVLNDSGDAFVESTDSSADDLLVATLVDGIVEGAYYETSSGVTGYTDENGNFNFREGDSVTFSVGGVVLGTATAEDIASGQTFLQDIADVDRTDLNDEYLENMAVFLQSIDTADSGDNIVITQAMRDALADVTIDLTTATEEEVKSLIESIGGNYVGEDAAMVHVQEMLQEYAGIDESEFDERISDDTLSATLGNEPQAGIEFTTSSGVSGITDDNGSFFYNVGDEITFTKDGEVLSTIDSNAIGDDSLITFNELESLNQTEIDFENLELDFDSLSEITDSEDITVYEKDESLEDKEIIMEDMLTSEDSDSSLSTLLGETEEDRNITSLDELKTEETTAQDDGNGEYCPFKALEESSGNLISNIEADDTTDIDDHNS
jgi:hypothetical protein